MTVLPDTVDVNIREFRGNSRNFWVAYDLNQQVKLTTKPYSGS